MKEQYNINELSMMTGLTTRTLRNYLQKGVLSGDKVDGAWTFSAEDIESFFAEPAVRKAMQAHRNALVYDFLADPFKKTNRVCTIMDFPVSTDEALDIARFFSTEIMDHGRDIEFRYINERHYARFILSGSEEQVAGLMKAYYGR